MSAAAAGGRPGEPRGQQPEQRGELGDGPLGRITAAVYRYLVLGVLVALGTLPTLLLLALLDRSSGNALLVPLCLLPAVPFLAAGLFALHALTVGTESATEPARAFARGLRLGWRDALLLWAPALAVLGVVTTSVVHREAAGISVAYAVVLCVVGAGVLLWAIEALLVASLFRFRARDVARLALHLLTRHPAVTLGLLALVVVAAGVVWIAGEVVLVLLLVGFLAFALRTARPALRDVEQRFTT